MPENLTEEAIKNLAYKELIDCIKECEKNIRDAKVLVKNPRLEYEKKSELYEKIKIYSSSLQNLKSVRDKCQEHHAQLKKDGKRRIIFRVIALIFIIISSCIPFINNNICAGASFDIMAYIFVLVVSITPFLVLFFSSNKTLRIIFLFAGVIWSLSCLSMLFSSSVEFCYTCDTEHRLATVISGIFSLVSYILLAIFPKKQVI